MSNYNLARNGQRHGPFTSAQLRAMAVAGQITRTDMIWKEGWTRWVAAGEVKGIFPTQRASESSVPRAYVTTQVQPPPASPVSPPSAIPVAYTTQAENVPFRPTAAGRWVIGISVVLLAGFLGWIVCWWLTPFTPREVCERWDSARTAQEAKKYCTLNMHHVVDQMFNDPGPDTDDPVEFTQEGDAPPNVGGYFVGVRMHFYSPEVRRRVQVDTVIHLIKSDGWKIEDIYFLSLDHQRLPEPISLAWLAANRGLGQPTSPPEPAAGGTTAKEWYTNPKIQKNVGRGALSWLAHGGGGKWLAGIGVAFLAAISALWKQITGQEDQVVHG